MIVSNKKKLIVDTCNSIMGGQNCAEWNKQDQKWIHII
jgi:hypothetical protein